MLSFVLTLCGLSLTSIHMTRLSGLVREETHSCGSNFIESIFETVQAGCINNVNVNVNLYSASSQKAPLMRSDVSSKLFHLSMTRFEKKTK